MYMVVSYWKQTGNEMQKQWEFERRENSQWVLEVAEALDLGAKEQVAELGEGEEDDEEHDGEPRQVLGAAAQGRRQLRHRLVEADVLEDLGE